MAKAKQYTPMMMQYIEMKKKHPDEIVFYRLGDFYEMFFDDAKVASQELDLVLTGKNAGVEERVPMCGIPYHAAQGYIQRLIQKGYKVAIVEQMENPATAKGIVKRDLLKIVTPGTIMDDMNHEKDSVYLAALNDYQFGICVVFCEMTTGELNVQYINKQFMSIQKVLLENHVVEIIVEDRFDKKLLKMIQNMNQITISTYNNHVENITYNNLCSFKDEKILRAFYLMINYLEETQRRNMSHLHPLKLVKEEDYLQMDYHTKENLELTQSIKSTNNKYNLWRFLDHCKSSMGSRTLKKWVEFPLIKIDEINNRLDTIDYLNDNFITKDELQENLSHVYDLERLNARIAYGNANPRDVLRLIQTLKHAPEIFSLLYDCDACKEFRNIDLCQDLLDKIDGCIVEEPPINIKDGGIFCEGYSEELDHVRSIKNNGQKWILELENKERERTGVKSLKIGYNRVFGYYIEVTKANLSYIKEEFGYVRKQTLTNAERFVSEELKNREEEILNAQEKSISLEIQLFEDLLNIIRQDLPKLYELAHALSVVDALYALAVVSSENGYTRPKFHNQHFIQLEEARHPILDVTMKNKRYVSNNLLLDDDHDILMITGPNMGGKSTYMRQTALITIMAQIGCFVPAKKAILPIFDKIFTRIGASDDIMSGQSTFMVEMMEANHALTHASENSLILFDEIGRGTSTYDGMALAQAMLEYIANKIHAKTLFSTHYHELTQLANHYPQVVNVHVDVHEEQENITFLYRVVEGKADKSYGINVARLAHLPNEVIERAKQILSTIEDGNEVEINVQSSAPIEITSITQHHPIIELIENVDADNMTAREALEFIYELKKQL